MKVKVSTFPNNVNSKVLKQWRSKLAKSQRPWSKTSTSLWFVERKKNAKITILFGKNKKPKKQRNFDFAKQFSPHLNTQSSVHLLMGDFSLTCSSAFSHFCSCSGFSCSKICASFCLYLLSRTFSFLLIKLLQIYSAPHTQPISKQQVYLVLLPRKS